MITLEGSRLRVQGPVTLATVTALCEAGKQQFPPAEIVVDLSGVTEVDSSALSMLFEWQREAQRRNSRIAFSNLPASLTSLATLYGVAELLGQTKT